MKYTLTLAVLLILCGQQASAQADYGLLASASSRISSTTPAYAVSPIVQDIQSYDGLGQYHPARLPGERMRKLGRLLTIGGAVMAIGGIAVYNNRDDDYNNGYYQNGYYYYESDPNEVLGSTMMVLGVGMMVPGVILWTKGAKKYNRALKRQEAEQSLSMNMKGNGVAVAYRF